MIFWIILFLLVVFASIILAVQSLKEAPRIDYYGLFLIRQRARVNLEFLNNLYNLMLSGQVLSLEKLFKGEKSALVIWAPKSIVSKLSIDLLELDDYTKADQNNVSSRSVTFPKILRITPPVLKKDEQFWIQLVFKKAAGKSYQSLLNTNSSSFEIALKKQLDKNSQQKSFFVALRVALLVADRQKGEGLEEFQKYQKRILEDGQNLTLNQLLTLIS